MNVTLEQVNQLKDVYKSNRNTLKELEQYIAENGITDDGLTDVAESFEQGYNNALEYVFSVLGIEPKMSVEELKQKSDYEFEYNISEEYKNNDYIDEWASAFVWLENIGVEYNLCIDNTSEEICNSSAIYKTASEGYLSTNYDEYVHYEINFNNPNWKAELENAMCEALIEFYDL